MFTVCPKCALTLVVTAADLRVAQGHVRCGRCSSVFNALAQLSDDRSATAAGDSEASPEEPQAEEPQSASPAATDEESRESPPAAAADGASKRSAPPAATDDESTPEYTLEFNPETTDAASLFVVAAPSPEWTAATGSFKGLATPEQQRAATAPEPKAQDADEDFEVELDAALLSDIVQSELAADRPLPPTREALAPAAPSRESAAPPATPRHTAHDRPEAPAAATRPAPVSTPPPAATSGSPGTAARTPADAAGRTPPATALKTPAPPTARTPDAAAASTPAGTTAKTPSVTAAATAATTARTPAVTAGKTSLAPAAQAPPAAAATAAAPAAKTPPATPAKTAAVVETTAPPQGDRAPDPQLPAPSGDVAFADLEAAAGATGQRAIRPQWQWAAGSALLMLILFAQIINHQRDALATDPRLSKSLSAVYTALGVQLTPRWDLRAYDVRQLGATVEAGATGAITVRASIRNAGTRPQPLPLLRVTLQDRFGNRLASRDVLPRDYLPSGMSPAASLAKDQRIDAELAFVDPGASAVGFELDACLPLGGGIVCANDTSAR
ncbi:MAG TPA: DUF3426 domain-containing protein [Steroidobacteraceae bacterium]